MMSTPEGHIEQATRFLEVAGLCRGGDSLVQAVVNAGLAAVNACSAVCRAFGQDAIDGESRDEAPALLRHACEGTRWEQDAAQQAPQLAGILRVCPDCYRGEPEPCTRAVESVLEQVRDLIEWAARVVDDQSS